MDTMQGTSTGLTDGTSTDMSGSTSRIIDAVLLIETGERVSVLGCRLHAYRGENRRHGGMQAEVLTGRPGNLREASLKEAQLKGVEFLVRPVAGSNAKESRDPQSGTMLSAASIMVNLNAEQANVGSTAARAVVESAAVVESKAVADSGDNLTVMMNSICLTKAEKGIIDV